MHWELMILHHHKCNGLTVNSIRPGASFEISTRTKKNNADKN